MNQIPIAMLALGLAMPGDGANPSKGMESLRPLHFRIEAVTDQVKTIAGRLEAAIEDGPTYDRAVLDLDGDGRPELLLGTWNDDVRLYRGGAGGTGAGWSPASDEPLVELPRGSHAVPAPGDLDGDGVDNALDNCPDDANSSQGDLDGDGGDEAVVMLWSGSGGSGTRSHVSVLDRVDVRAVNVATRLLGDRAQLRGITLDAGVIRLDVVSAGPQDAACCPGDLASLAWRLGPGGLEDAEPPRVSGRLGLAALEGSAWRLAKLAWSEPAPPSPGVTLTWTEGRFAGNAGCNEYHAGARDGGEMPGGIVLDPPAATRKICPPEAMQVEERFLAQLGAVRRLGFMSGRLMLDDQGGAGMLFDRIETVATP